MDDRNKELQEETVENIKEVENGAVSSTMDISNNEIKSLNDYIKRHNTAILVIMFTDIQGFTRMTEIKGEMYSSKIRKYHDEILVSTIEEEDSGKVIKFIGDAVMAVFSEPITAVRKSLSIQRKLRKFNEEHHELDDIKVRIGLHMGQVAIEDNIHADVFGRHVNRASRIEGLAAGGQVYITFPVFDSAKGWMLDDETISWKFHGSYYLKGIDKPAEIYEVFNVGETSPAPPQRAKKVKKVATPLIASFVVLLVVVLALLSKDFLKKEKKVYVPPKVIFVDHKIQVPVFLDNDTVRIVQDKDHKEHLRTSLIPISPGSHTSHWNFSSLLRFYAPFTVKEGENLIELRYDRHELPDMHLNGAVYPENKLALHKTVTDTISYYDNKQNLHKKEVTLEASVIGEQQGDSINYIFSYSIEYEGEKSYDNKVVRSCSAKGPSDWSKWTEFYSVEGTPFSFDYRYRTSKNFVNFYVAGAWD